MFVILEKLYNTKVVGNKFRPQQVEEKEKKSGINSLPRGCLLDVGCSPGLLRC